MDPGQAQALSGCPGPLLPSGAVAIPGLLEADRRAPGEQGWVWGRAASITALTDAQHLTASLCLLLLRKHIVTLFPR